MRFYDDTFSNTQTKYLEAIVRRDANLYQIRLWWGVSAKSKTQRISNERRELTLRICRPPRPWTRPTDHFAVQQYANPQWSVRRAAIIRNVDDLTANDVYNCRIRQTSGYKNKRAQDVYGRNLEANHSDIRSCVHADPF